jgi:hypothetical protein
MSEETRQAIKRVFWELFGPDACRCGEPFWPDQTPLMTAEGSNRVSVQCAKCKLVYTLGRLTKE